MAYDNYVLINTGNCAAWTEGNLAPIFIEILSLPLLFNIPTQKIKCAHLIISHWHSFEAAILSFWVRVPYSHSK